MKNKIVFMTILLVFSAGAKLFAGNPPDEGNVAAHSR